MLSIGIVGLPNIGKSTLFQAITKKQVAIANFPFTTIDPNIGLAPVTDERLEKIAEIQKSKNVIPATVKFVDIAGLVKGAAQGMGLGNQFLSHIRETTAIAEVVRLFSAPNVPHVEEKIDPLRDLEIISTELVLADLETLGKVFKKIESDVKRKEKTAQQKFELIQKLEKHLQNGHWVSTFPLNENEKELIKEFNFLTQKPLLIVLNVDDSITPTEIEKIKEEVIEHVGSQVSKNDIFAINLAKELDLASLSKEEAAELNITRLPFLNTLDDLIKRGYEVLDLITFFTSNGPEETRAWPLKRGSTVWEAAGLIHKDFQDKFIKAEIVNWRDFIECGSWAKAREMGKLKVEGRDYIVNDGDIIYYKI
ncbi:MAG TPA: redox-regulated ATPase YchF [Candidatus Paceibacterota bacterium]|nr:redox-regulated ATPase YchF [Candidatus Paceibacterota bacterium]